MRIRYCRDQQTDARLSADCLGNIAQLRRKDNTNDLDGVRSLIRSSATIASKTAEHWCKLCTDFRTAAQSNAK
jgi:hypothetical protein